MISLSKYQTKTFGKYFFFWAAFPFLTCNKKNVVILNLLRFRKLGVFWFYQLIDARVNIGTVRNANRC